MKIFVLFSRILRVHIHQQQNIPSTHGFLVIVEAAAAAVPVSCAANTIIRGTTTNQPSGSILC
jgi:hypothetical protein